MYASNLKCKNLLALLEIELASELGSLLKNILLFAFAPVYSMFVIWTALYVKVAFNVNGFITIFTAIAPVVAIWAKIVHTRETKSMEALARSYKTSPEKQARILDEYVRLLKKNEETES